MTIRRPFWIVLLRVQLGLTPMLLGYRDSQLDELLRHDGKAGLDATCVHCKKDPAVYKCKDCFGLKVFCLQCLIAEHHCHPLHRVVVWNGRYWDRTALYKLGLKVHFGHNGAKCSSPVEFANPLAVVHTNGLHSIRVVYCECRTSPGGYYFGDQLIRSTWFPATVARPRTVFTFEVLDHFHHLTLQGKTTAWDFYNALVHETDNSGLSLPSAI